MTGSMTDSTAPTIPTASLPGGEMPLFGLGTWRSSGDECYRAVRHALDVGYRHIDTATMYANEDQVGRAIRDSGVPREQLFVTTKLPPEAAGREQETLAASLGALGTAYVDLWLVHWPPSGEASPWVWERFVEARNSGYAASIGVSNYSVEQCDILSEQVGETPAVNQIPWSPAEYDAHIDSGLHKRGIVLEGYSPFRRSDLDHPVLTEVAERHQVTPAQVVVRWHIEHGFVVIPKSVHAERIDENLAGLAVALNPDEVAQIDGLGRV